MKTEKLRPETIAEFRIPGNLIYSPDGEHLAFFVERADEANNSIHYDTWLVASDGCRQMTFSNDAVPVLWLDDSRLLLRRQTGETLPGTTQLFVLNIHGGEAKPYAVLPFAMHAMSRTGKDTFAALGTVDARDPDAFLDTEEERKRKLEEKKKEQDYQILDEVNWSADGTGIINGTREALYEVKIGNDVKVKRVTGTDVTVTSWFIKDGQVYYIAAHMDNPSLFIMHTVHLYHNGRNRTIYGKRTHRISSVFVLNDKVFVQATDMKEYGVKETPSFCLVENQKLKPLLKPSFSLTNNVNGDLRPRGSAAMQVRDGRLYTLAVVEDHTELWSYDEDMHCEVLFRDAGNISSIAVGNKHIALLRQNWQTPPEIYELAEGEAVRKTFFSEEFQKRTKAPELRRVDYTSGEESLHGWVVLPEGYNPKKKYPAILDMHGGPRVTYGEVFSFEKQLFAQHGYFVFYTNVRGSDGRDDAFADIRGKFGAVDYENFMDFTDAVLKEFPAIDETRLCVMGLSYGGYMTSRIITRTDRFCAASIQGPVINWISMNLTADIGFWFGPDQTASRSLFDLETAWQTSPLRYADQVKTPALFLLGQEDYRCPKWEGMQMMQALTVQNIETRMVLFKGGSHNMHYIGLPQTKIRRLKEIISWFDKHTGKEHV